MSDQHFDLIAFFLCSARRDPNLAMKSRCFKLSNGLNLPAVGLGTYRIRKVDDVRLAVNAAIRSGYRLIDTAAVYNNEDSIAQTLEGIYADQAISVKVFLAISMMIVNG